MRQHPTIMKLINIIYKYLCYNDTGANNRSHIDSSQLFCAQSNSDSLKGTANINHFFQWIFKEIILKIKIVVII
jgi:hypothetical protein